jgi:hypothetical protein
VCLLRGTDWVFIYNSTFCPHSVFMCFVWIWEQTAIISLYYINWLFYNQDGVCLLRGTDWIFTYNKYSLYFQCFIQNGSYADLPAHFRPTLTPTLHWLAVSLILRFINPRCNNPGTQGTGRWWKANRSGRIQAHCISAPVWNGTPTSQLAASTTAVWKTTVSHTVQNRTASQTRSAFWRHDSEEAAQ